MRATTALLLILCLCACSNMQAKSWVEIKGQRFQVEIADDNAERARGLMFRDNLEKNHGMLFVHDKEERQAYWMKNTKIALDILYFNKDRKLVSAQERVPPCSAGDRCPPYPSDDAALYVLELNAGSVELLQINPGDELIFSPDIPKTGAP